LILIVGSILLAGEQMSEQGFETRTTENPSSAVGMNEEQLTYGDAEPQQMMKSSSFVIRPGQSKLGYTEAVGLYGNSILQFDGDCQLSSKNRSFSLNNEVMIDNRSAKPNTFAVGDASIVLGPYDFGFMILRQKGAVVPVDCGIRRNVSTLSVQ
jgi:hypothetical protein